LAGAKNRRKISNTETKTIETYEQRTEVSILHIEYKYITVGRKRVGEKT
jgi:hypothetical protein